MIVIITKHGRCGLFGHIYVLYIYSPSGDNLLLFKPLNTLLTLCFIMEVPKYISTYNCICFYLGLLSVVLMAAVKQCKTAEIKERLTADKTENCE